MNKFVPPDTYKLLMKTRGKVKVAKYKYVWARNNQIFVRKDENSDKFTINCDFDLNKIQKQQIDSTINSKNKASSPLTILSLNVNSFIGHVAQFLALVNDIKPEIIFSG